MLNLNVNTEHSIKHIQYKLTTFTNFNIKRSARRRLHAVQTTKKAQQHGKSAERTMRMPRIIWRAAWECRSCRKLALDWMLFYYEKFHQSQKLFSCLIKFTTCWGRLFPEHFYLVAFCEGTISFDLLII